MSTGWDSLDAKIGFGYSSLDTAATLSSVISDVKAIRIRRGRTSPFEGFSQGSLALVLDNRARAYDPNYASGAHFGQIKPLLRVQVSVNDSASKGNNLFTGFIAPPPYGWAFEYPDSGRDAEATVTAYDGFLHLGANSLPPQDPAYGAELSGARITRVLDTIGWPAAWRTLDTGLTILQPTTYGQSALDHLQLVSLSEGGALYVDVSGNVTFDSRHAIFSDTRMSASQTTFDDGTSNTNMRVVEWSFGGDLRNCARIARSGGPIQEYTDATSMATNGQQCVDWHDLYMQNDPDAYARGEWIVKAYKDGLFAPSVIEIEATEDNNSLDAAAHRELRDRVTVTWSPPGGGSANSQASFIEGIEHTIPIAHSPRVWTTRYTLSSASRFGFTNLSDYLKLDDATLGKLNTGKLAF